MVYQPVLWMCVRVLFSSTWQVLTSPRKPLQALSFLQATLASQERCPINPTQMCVHIMICRCHLYHRLHHLYNNRFADVQFTNNPAKYIKYSASDVGSIIDDDLFETKAVSMNKLSLTKEKLGAIV